MVKIGDRVRLKCGATGRFIGDELGLYVSASCNDLGVDRVDPEGIAPHPTLPVPGDGEVEAAHVAVVHYKITRRTETEGQEQ